MKAFFCKKQWFLWFSALGLPCAGIGLFYLLRSHRSLMNAWVTHIMAPWEQFWGRIWSLFPFSVGESVVALLIAAVVIWTVRALVLLIRQHRGREFFRRMGAVASILLWAWCLLCWLWNVSYYADSFAEKSGLVSYGHTPEALFYTTVWFAQNAAQLSDQIPRDENGHFALSPEECFERGTAIYDNLTAEFPFLDIPGVRAKPLLFSRLQSILGFTGVYLPFTGEANVNIDAPACLIPATIGHEMSHQGMVAAEQEANFVGIAACLSCDDVVFQYSGYLHGLVHLSNALYQLDPSLWTVITENFFTPELSTDWNDNYFYWKELESPTEERAEQTYDAFLKGNGQSLGIASYGACVDLLITYYYPKLMSS